MLEDWLPTRLALGRHAEVSAELEGLIRRHPHRERLRGQHMLALYRAGRQAEALASHRGLWRFLDRLGAFARVLLWDKRGTGQSDRIAAGTRPTLAERTADFATVIDAAGFRRPAGARAVGGQPPSPPSTPRPVPSGRGRGRSRSTAGGPGRCGRPTTRGARRRSVYPGPTGREAPGGAMGGMPPLEIRPIRPEDRPALADAFERLSAESRHRRFLGPKPVLSPQELTRLTEVDHVTHEALVAITAGGRLVGVARYAAWPGRPGVAEVAVTIADDWQGRRLGTVLARRVIEAARANGMHELTGSALWENARARRLLARLGFRPVGSQAGVIEFRLALDADAARHAVGASPTASRVA